MTIYYKACEAVTGYPIADLPNFSVDYLKATLGRAESMTGTLPISPADPKAPENWVAASDPWCVAIFAIDSDTQQPVGAPMYINGRVRTQGDVATLPLVTAEGYLDRRQIGNYTPTATDQNTIGVQLVTQFAAAASAAGLNGWPVIFNIVGAAGMARDRTYAITDRKTVLAALTELMGVQGGPEFTVTGTHLTGPERWLPVFNIGTMIGNPVTSGLLPAVQFQLGGSSEGGTITDFAYTEDFTDGKGANYVTAWALTDATTGANLTQSVAYTGNPRQLQLDYEWNPSTSITTAADLLLHAQQQLPIMQKGSRSLAMTIKGDKFPQVGTDWNLGDAVGYAIGGKDQAGKETIPSLPGGITGVSRVIGWQKQGDVPTPLTTPILGGV